MSFLRAAAAILLLFGGIYLFHGPDARAASNLSGCVNGQMVQANNGAALTCIKGATLTISARAIPIGSTGDQGLLSLPAGVTKYQILNVFLTNCTAIPVLAQPQVNTLANAGGTSVVDPATITGATNAGIILPRTLTAITGTNAFNAASLFVNMSVANALPATCDFYATVKDLT